MKVVEGDVELRRSWDQMGEVGASTHHHCPVDGESEGQASWHFRHLEVGLQVTEQKVHMIIGLSCKAMMDGGEFSRPGLFPVTEGVKVCEGVHKGVIWQLQFRLQAFRRPEDGVKPSMR